MAYLLDADVLIRAKNLHYGLDFCPAFWEWLVEKNDTGQGPGQRRVSGSALASEGESI